MEGSRAVFGVQASIPRSANDANPCTFSQAQLFERGAHRPHERQLLDSAPTLELLLAADGHSRIIECLELNQPFDSIWFAKALDHSMPVVIPAPWEIGGNANVQNSAAT